MGRGNRGRRERGRRGRRGRGRRGRKSRGGGTGRGGEGVGGGRGEGEAGAEGEGGGRKVGVTFTKGGSYIHERWELHSRKVIPLIQSPTCMCNSNPHHAHTQARALKHKTLIITGEHTRETVPPLGQTTASFPGLGPLSHSGGENGTATRQNLNGGLGMRLGKIWVLR